MFRFSCTGTSPEVSVKLNTPLYLEAEKWYACLKFFSLRVDCLENIPPCFFEFKLPNQAQYKFKEIQGKFLSIEDLLTELAVSSKIRFKVLSNRKIKCIFPPGVSMKLDEKLTEILGFKSGETLQNGVESSFPWDLWCFNGPILLESDFLKPQLLDSDFRKFFSLFNPVYSGFNNPTLIIEPKHLEWKQIDNLHEMNYFNLKLKNLRTGHLCRFTSDATVVFIASFEFQKW